MIDPTRKKAILDAEREFERHERLSQALAVSGITLIGRITSPAPEPQADAGAPPETDPAG